MLSQRGAPEVQRRKPHPVVALAQQIGIAVHHSPKGGGDNSEGQQRKADDGIHAAGDMAHDEVQSRRQHHHFEVGSHIPVDPPRHRQENVRKAHLRDPRERRQQQKEHAVENKLQPQQDKRLEAQGITILPIPQPAAQESKAVDSAEYQRVDEGVYKQTDPRAGAQIPQQGKEMNAYHKPGRQNAQPVHSRLSVLHSPCSFAKSCLNTPRHSFAKRRIFTRSPVKT